MAQNGDKTSLLLIATSLLWIVQMLVSKNYNISPAVEGTQENYKLLGFELFTKILGICTVMLANCMLLSTCSGGQIHQTLPQRAQFVFLFFAMIFAGDYGIPVAYFFEVIRGAGKVNDDLKLYPLYKKTWSHNVVFQIGMYVLFILIIIVEQIHIYKVCHQQQSSRLSEPQVSDSTVTSSATDLLTSSSSRYCPWPNLEEVIFGYCDRNILRYSIRFWWPVVLAISIDYYSHTMKIYLITTAFYVVILLLLILFRCIRYSRGTNWSDFHRQCHPMENSTALQITFGVFLKVSIWGLVFLLLIIFYQEVGMTSNNLILVGFPTLFLLFIVCLLHVSDIP